MYFVKKRYGSCLCDMQISYEMASYAHVCQLTAPVDVTLVVLKGLNVMMEIYIVYICTTIYTMTCL